MNLRRTIYLTIVSSLDFEEAGHKLMKIKLPAGQEIELCTMIIECCAQERSYTRRATHPLPTTDATAHRSVCPIHQSHQSL